MAKPNPILISSIPEVQDPLFSSIPTDEIDRKQILPYAEADRVKIGRAYRAVKIRFDPKLNKPVMELLVSEIISVSQFLAEVRRQIDVPETEIIVLRQNSKTLSEKQIFAEFKLNDPLFDWIELEALTVSGNYSWWQKYCNLL